MPEWCVRERPPAAVGRQATVAAAAVLAAVLVAMPQLDPNRLPIFTSAAAFVIIFASLHLLVRTSGQVSLCHMAFAAVGAATFAHAQSAGFPFVAAVLAGGLVAVPVGAFIAIPAIRLPGIYLAIATFGFGILMQNLFFPSFLLFGARLTQRVARPSFARGDTAYYYVVLVVALLCCGVVVGVRSSRLGRLLRALADSPAAVVAHGASTNVIRTLAFCIAAFLAGVAGALTGPITQSATGGTYDFQVSLVLIGVLYIFGRRPVVTAFLAAAAYIVLPTYSTSADAAIWAQVAFGLVAILVACDAFGALGRRWTVDSIRAGERTSMTPARARAEVSVA